jgi:hypothetical protein
VVKMNLFLSTGLPPIRGRSAAPPWPGSAIDQHLRFSSCFPGGPEFVTRHLVLPLIPTSGFAAQLYTLT